jgi:RNA polymerase sigma-70 factor (sigma-E family)
MVRNKVGVRCVGRDVRVGSPDPDAMEAVAKPVSVSFEELVAATGDQLLRTAALLTGNRDSAEDLVQATYARVFARWRHVSRADNPAAYASTVLTRLFISDKRRRRLREVPWRQGHDPAARAADPSLSVSVLGALTTLPPLDRAVLVLRYYNDLSFNDVAGQLGISSGACRTRASRALARLRVRFPDLAE